MSELLVESGIVERLLGSFVDLEKAINNARNALAKNTDVPAEVFERLDSYGGIIQKQRALTNELSAFVRSGNVNQIMRHVSLINGLSGMIIDDARGILEKFQASEHESSASEIKEDVYYC